MTLMDMMKIREVKQMKKISKLNELKVGQKIYLFKDRKEKPYVIRSLEDKLVPYVITTDNSAHSILSGIWIENK